MDLYDGLQELIATTDSDAEKYYKNQDAEAGLRLRVKMNEIKVIAQAIRLDIQVKKKLKIDSRYGRCLPTKILRFGLRFFSFLIKAWTNFYP